MKRASETAWPGGRLTAGLLWWFACPALFLACSEAHAQTGPVVARAASVSGRNLLYSPGGPPVALTAGYLLNPGDRIDTRGGGRVVIDLSDGSMVVVQPESVVVLKDFQQAASLRELFEIAVGMVRVRINHFVGRPNPYRMNSPTASIAVRGTEFSIEVASQGDTRVVVYEGAVEVASLRDPDRRTLIEAGRGVLVQAGQDFHFLGRNEPGPARNGQDRDRRPPIAVANAEGPPPKAQATPLAGGPGDGGHVEGYPLPGPAPHAEPGEHKESQRAIATAYERYIAGLSDISQIPFLFRYNAFAERHLDSLENPAYATEFTNGEARAFLLPAFRGVRGFEAYQSSLEPRGRLTGDYRMTPQFSLFTPLAGTGFTVGGSVSASRAGGSGSPTDTFYSGALALARRWGANSVGLGAESLKGTGSFNADAARSSSEISQNRLTAGFSRELTRTAKVGLFYRYALLSANDSLRAAGLDGVAFNATRMSGHSSEFGLRLRGALSRRVWYGVVGTWLGVSLREGLVRPEAVDSLQRDRIQRTSVGLGLGYAPTRRILLSFDLAGGSARNHAIRVEDGTGSVLQNGDANRRFASVHGAMQTDLSRHLFVSASFLKVWQRSLQTVAIFPDRFGNCVTVQDPFFPSAAAVYPVGRRFSDFGAGWRFTPSFFAQYLYSTDYGVGPASHTLMLRYTFQLHRE